MFEMPAGRPEDVGGGDGGLSGPGRRETAYTGLWGDGPGEGNSSSQISLHPGITSKITDAWATAVEIMV